MTKSSKRIGLGLAVIGLLTSAFELASAIVELVTKVVSYARCNPQLRLHLPAQR
ncbi:hypothetical protein [Brevundimonas sp.]|jgi:hypothetical protein|uniref:hypothetical protein n=1 Tax=Brevundimonas sp. TaxID=1871086 RepID=UPI0028B23691|nr:hypothetical protein [Brevundimonas sp.]